MYPKQLITSVYHAIHAVQFENCLELIKLVAGGEDQWEAEGSDKEEKPLKSRHGEGIPGRCKPWRLIKVADAPVEPLCSSIEQHIQ